MPTIVAARFFAAYACAGNPNSPPAPNVVALIVVFATAGSYFKPSAAATLSPFANRGASPAPVRVSFNVAVPESVVAT